MPRVTTSDHNRTFSIDGFEITVAYTGESNAAKAVKLDGEIIPAIQKGLALLDISEEVVACLKIMEGALQSCSDRSVIDTTIANGMTRYAKRIVKALEAGAPLKKNDNADHLATPEFLRHMTKLNHPCTAYVDEITDDYIVLMEDGCGGLAVKGQSVCLDDDGKLAALAKGDRDLSLRLLLYAFHNAMSAGILDEIPANCSNPDSVNDVFDAVKSMLEG